jgi:hypothetical protein
MIPNMLSEVERCKDENPVQWRNAHTGNAQTEDFIRILAARLYAIDTRFGLNGKRGNPNDISDDIINYIGEGPGIDPITGKPVSLFDVIVNAGAQPPYTTENPAPTAAWNLIDLTGPGAWVKPGPAAPPVVVVPPPAILPPGREEALDELNWLHAYYKAPEGLQRPDGLWRPDTVPPGPDFEGISAWYLDVYQRERMAGRSRADARAAYVAQIRRSAEWQAKHPGVTP